jgi:hypothetical protein
MTPQQEFILGEYKKYPVVPSSHFVNNGIYRYSARIFELREMGYDIGLSYKIKNGKQTKTALYFLKDDEQRVNCETVKDGVVLNYIEYLNGRSNSSENFGFNPLWMPDFLFDFQKHLVEWSLKKGKGAMFADCGMGKTPMQLVWAENIVRKTNKNVLIITPLAVSSQTQKEAGKFDIDAKKSNEGEIYKITITNYEKLHYFDPNDFVGAVCDESSILKSFDGKRKKQITKFMRKMKYRFLYTATAAPNDYIELGTSSESLGYLGHMDMLMKFFKNDQNSIKATWARRWENPHQRFGGGLWRFKAHGEDPFWRWVCSWARATRMPSDLGFDDGDFILPPKEEIEHIVRASRPLNGMLFSMPAIGLREEREERKSTLNERCEKIASLVNSNDPVLVWCHYNEEGDLLEKLIPDSVQVAGRHPDRLKEERLLGFANGQFRVLITKPKIGAWGLNYQHCSHITFFPSHSFEQYYQGVRRCWRFGQKNKVKIDIVSTEGELNVLKNLQRKARSADKMFEKIVMFMNDHLNINNIKNYDKKEEVPEWLNVRK